MELGPGWALYLAIFPIGPTESIRDKPSCNTCEPLCTECARILKTGEATSTQCMEARKCCGGFGPEYASPGKTFQAASTEYAGFGKSREPIVPECTSFRKCFQSFVPQYAPFGKSREGRRTQYASLRKS
jgi:hypothetical protein